jgi:hypothetical protein
MVIDIRSHRSSWLLDLNILCHKRIFGQGMEDTYMYIDRRVMRAMTITTSYCIQPRNTKNNKRHGTR